MTEMPSHLPAAQRPGRAAASNQAGRFEPYVRVPVDDGWGRHEPLPPLQAEVADERPRRMIATNNSPDIPFDRSLNPYRGCEHGCIYCFARPTHAYLGLSAGLDFETRLIAKPTAPIVLARELAQRGYVPKVLAVGTATDPYQPIERDRRIMRGLIEVLGEHRHPFTITTKGTLIERDIDLLAPLAKLGLVNVGLSLTTLDAAVSRAMEPRAPTPERRLLTLQRLSACGIPVRVQVSPVVPALTDHELEVIMSAAREAGAHAASMIVLRLPREVSPLFRQWVVERFPDRATRILNRVRDLHGGRDYDPEWNTRMTGQGTWAQLLAARFELARKRLGFLPLPPLQTDLFTVPKPPDCQLSLF
ncbi:PA0069 family radical SAM protein [Rubellimicrobium rubrum]|uniref:PA0069 family radical SAM protein n=1 Tax=Rubellimicrobium rubrum TaxID=2585369 RepID=A0A5C4MYC9_9RHOB|nr:PA0069 family radical SAM protein [Rubellimicrobium rubrum]TNC50477.1 PA0069 family radical SAM protein [Rubellimicrobium rubrum]